MTLAIGAALTAPDWAFGQICDPGTVCTSQGPPAGAVDAQPLGPTSRPAPARQAMDPRNRAAFEAYQAQMVDYEARKAADAADKSAAEQAYAATFAAHQAKVADWQARVSACKSGDTSQCAH
jgi:hypothetical protein